METIDSKLVTDGVKTLLKEVLFGSSGPGAWIINSTDAGLLASLDTISAEEASRTLIPGRSSIAGHSDHLRFSLNLLNRSAAGENAFEGADWDSSWRKQSVDEATWGEVRRELRKEGEQWVEAMVRPRDWDTIFLTGTIASVAHAAYHLGAVRQLTGHLGR